MSEATWGWADATVRIAREILRYRDDRSSLIDHLAWALEKAYVQFPVIEPGEDFDDICPFTFMASFGRPTTDERRGRLVSLVCESLGIKAPTAWSGDEFPNIPDYQARFFSRRERSKTTEIEALWNLFEAAVNVTDPESGERGTDEGWQRFEKAFDRVVAVRAPGVVALPTALTWVSPKHFAPLATADDNKAPVPSGASYREYLGNLGASAYAAYLLNAKAVNGTRKPALDTAITNALLDSYLTHIEVWRKEERPNIWGAVSRFQQVWDLAAPDFGTMVSAALDAHDGLLFSGYYYNPLKEVTVFAQKEPDVTRAAFELLFNRERPLEERIVPFERTMNALFERHRGAIASATPRPSSHSNWHAVSTYLFLRYPDECHLFTPSQLRALDKLCGYGCHYRLVNPECVSQYFALCDALCEHLETRPDVLAADTATRPEGAYPDPAHHLLVNDIAAFAVKLDAGEIS